MRNIGMVRSFKKRMARHRILKEISREPEFLWRQGVHNGELDRIRKGLRYTFEGAFKGAIGYIAHGLGITPSCIYVGTPERKKIN